MLGISDEEIAEIELRRRDLFRNQRRVLVFAMFCVAAGAAAYFLTDSFPLPNDLRFKLLTFCAGSFLGGLSLILWHYLRGGFSFSPRFDSGLYGESYSSSYSFRDYSATSYDELRKELDKLRSDFAGLQAGKPKGTYADVIHEFRGSITTEIVNEIEKRFSDEALANAQLQEFKATFANSYTRLASALGELNRRGNLNLVIGVITTILAAGILAYMALKAPPFSTVPDILAHYIPRLSTVIFIEVFSFFFLRLYKATLNESKFYQMELIAMARVDLAIQAALRSSDAKTMAALVGQLAASGRVDFNEAVSKEDEFNGKGFADILERVGKLAIEVGKHKA